MSAIFGIIDFEGRPLEEKWIKSMQADLAHRGPDGQGLYREPSVALGHMLLQVTPESIYDKSPYEEDGFVITANARLDERGAIMDRIGTPQSERDKITDPLLLLRSFRKFGKDFVKDIYGDFAFAIWDKNKRELFCARDQVGIKPFLYYFQDKRFVFSTEIRAIVKLSFVNTEIDQISLRNRVIGLWTDSQKTNWKNIFRINHANSLVINSVKLITNQYWYPKYKRNPKFRTEEESAWELKILLRQAIEDRMRVTKRIGVPLSGGLDSSTITCLAASKYELEGKKIVTVSSILDPDHAEKDENDELEFIKEVLEQEINIDPFFIHHSSLRFLYGIDVQFERKFAPISDLHYVDTALFYQFQKNSVNRILSGYPGDETVSNKSIKPILNLLQTLRIMACIKTCIKVRKNMSLSWFIFIKSQVLFYLIPLWLHKLLNSIRGLESKWDIELLPLRFDRTERKILQKEKDKMWKSFMQQRNITSHIWQNKCENFEEEHDCRSSYYDLEITYPLADRRIIEFLLTIPVEHFYAEGQARGLIRKAMIDILPEKIRKRKDKGYYSPGMDRILSKDSALLNSLINNVAQDYEISRLLDINKLNLELAKLENINNSNIFGVGFNSLHQISIWLSFNKWLKKNKLTNMKKYLKKSWNKPQIKQALPVNQTLGNKTGLRTDNSPSGKKYS